MALEAGTRLGHYEVVSSLGAGGMGEVYRAKDTKLGREVAIKLLLEEVASDPERLARFEREAKVLASLNHNNIATLHGFEKEGDTSFLVMELVEGETLGARIKRGAIPVDEALSLFLQIAKGLEAAHEKGVIHRDLKPANIKITADGVVKVLDFGLAKALDDGDSGASVDSQAMTLAATQHGVIVGTPAYMSPEQARGQPIDKRTDIWSFGCLVFEMLTGRSPFAGADVAETFVLILERELDWTPLEARAPERWVRLVRRCLDRDPKRRLRDIGDARIEIEDFLEEGTGASSPQVTGAAAGPPRRRLVPSLVVAAAGALAGAALAWFALLPEPPLVQRLYVHSRGAQTGSLTSSEQLLAISPDGQSIAATTSNQLVLRRLDSLSTTTFPGLGNPINPFFSPDGEWIGFVDGTTMNKVHVSGGPATSIVEIGATAILGAAWGSDGRIVFATNHGATGLLRVPAAGGSIEVLTSVDAAAGEHLFPALLPGNEAVLFTIGSGSAETAQVAVLDLETKDWNIVLRGASDAQHVSTGHLVYASGGGLWAIGFDLDRLETIGAAEMVEEQVMAQGSSGGGQFSISHEGSLVYLRGTPPDPSQRTVVWVDRAGVVEETGIPAGSYNHVRVSPDGTRAALDVHDQEDDIWLWNFSSTSLDRLLFSPQSADRQPVWSRDGQRIAFASDRDEGVLQVYWQSADGESETSRLMNTVAASAPTSFLHDGSGVIFWRASEDTGPDIGVVYTDGGASSGLEMLVETPVVERNAELSPDGRWLAYQSNETGRYEIWVAPFDDPRRERRSQLTFDGGTCPSWSEQGDEIFFLKEGRRMMALSVRAGAGVERLGDPIELFRGPYDVPYLSRYYDYSPHHGRFLMVRLGPGEDRASSPQDVVLVRNWFEEVERRVPVE